jgi:Cu(I)/Ag(I) efflux system membrane fusion protein
MHAIGDDPIDSTAATEESRPGPRYICPMHAEIVSVDPADCSICGMDLVPIREEEVSGNGEKGGDTVTISPRLVNDLGVRTVAVERGELTRRIETVGYVEYDRTRLRHIYPPTDGQIEELAVRSEGERVRKGQFLFQLFSPVLYVTQTTLIITLADLDSVWVLADVFEDQANWVRPGQSAEVHLPYVPGRVWQGKVEYVYPNLDPETRTLKVRMRFDNPDEVLKPNMHADVTIDCGSLGDVLSVPRDAVIETERERRVILALGDGRYRPQPVLLGAEVGNRVEILDGLGAGDEVVISAQFLIDSEANLKASLSRMTESDGAHADHEN